VLCPSLVSDGDRLARDRWGWTRNYRDFSNCALAKGRGTGGTRGKIFVGYVLFFSVSHCLVRVISAGSRL